MPLCAAGVGDDAAEVVDEVVGRATATKYQVAATEQRAVLRVAAKVVPARQVVAERPLAPVAAAVPMQCAEERVEGGWLTLVGGWDQRASRPGRAITRVRLDSWQVSLERHLRVIDVEVPSRQRAAEQEGLWVDRGVPVRPDRLIGQPVKAGIGVRTAVDVDEHGLRSGEAEVVITVRR